ncbi:MAG: DPP IV N-terminal domain-containing protein [Saprospiraceae bacterium]
MKKFALLLFFLPLLLSAQQPITMADAIMKARTSLAPANLRQLQWIPGGSQFTYVAGSKLVRLDATKPAVSDTLDWLPRLNEGLAAQGKTALTALPALNWFDANSLWFQNGAELFTWMPKDGATAFKTRIPAEAENTDIHPKTLDAAYTSGNELRIARGENTVLVAQSESEGIVYGKSVHRDEFGIHKGTYWSPSGKKLAFYRMDESMVTQYPIYVLDSMPAQQREIRYPFAGSQSHHVTVGVYDLASGKTIYLQTGEPAEQYLTNVSWSPDDKYILIAVLNRGQNHLWFNQYDATTGAFVKTLFEETSDRWVEPEHPAEFVPGSNTDFVWQSERDGFNHLYLYNLSGQMLRQISFGNAPVTNFIGFTENGKRCFFQMADDNGLNRYCYTAEVYPANGIFRLQTDAGIHNALPSSNGEWVLDLYSSPTVPREIAVIPVKKPEKRRVIFTAPNPLKDVQLGETRLVALNSPGGVPLNARLILPVNFDPNKRYPALVYVYNGPHVQMVTNSWLNGGELWMHRMAEQGVAVFVLDGRGSDNRGYAFESAIFRHCGDAEVADQLAGASYLKSLPYIDSTRLGVYGWSYGGFMATSLMTRPEAKGVFRCGIAGGPVIDWRMYEIMYTERYMDTPQENPEGYDKASLFNYIDNLNGRLLMIHGSSDDVVLWQHSLRYIRECVRKGKPIDYFVYPEHLHNVMGKDRVHLFEKVEQFFMENLKVENSVRP